MRVLVSKIGLGLSRYTAWLNGDKRLAYLVIVALTIRIALAPFFMHSHDFAVFYSAAHNTVVNHINVYTPEAEKIVGGLLPYPPAWLYVLCTFYVLFLLTPFAQGGEVISHMTPCPFWMNYWLILTLKTPLIIADMAIALLLYTIVLKVVGDRRQALLAFCLWAFNPYVILCSMRGAFDVIPTLLTLLACKYFLDERYEKSALAEGLGIAFKTYPILIIPAFAFPLWVRNRRLCYKYLVISLATPLLISLPYIIADASKFIKVVLSAYREEATSFSVWSLLINLREDYGLFPFSFAGVSSYLMLFVYGFSCLAIGKGLVEEPTNTYRACALLMFPYYLAATLVHDHYFLWILPFLILAAFFRDFDVRILIGQCVLASTIVVVASMFLYDFIAPLIYKNQDYYWQLFWKTYHSIFPEGYVGHLMRYSFTFVFWLTCLYVYYKIVEAMLRSERS